MFTKKKKIILFLTVIIGFLAVAGYFNIIAGSSFGNRKNILVFGVDSHSKDSKTPSRSDSIMLFSFGGGGKPMLISIPRDSRVSIPGRQNLDKINHAHAYGEEELLIATVEDLFKIKVHNYIRINYKAIEELVDALGGIEVDVPIDMKYSDPYDKPPLNIDIKKGLQVLDGKNALHFLRFRKGYANQDLGRINAQQDFAQALISKLASPLTVFKAPKLLGTFYRNVDTDLSKREIIAMGFKVIRMKLDSIERLTLAGTNKSINGISYFIINEGELSKLQAELASVKTSGRIEVLNGNGGVGVATKYADILRAENIVIESIGNHHSMDILESYIEYSPDFKKEAKKIAKILGIDNLYLNDLGNGEADITVIIGKDLE